MTEFHSFTHRTLTTEKHSLYYPNFKPKTSVSSSYSKPLILVTTGRVSARKSARKSTTAESERLKNARTINQTNQSRKRQRENRESSDEFDQIEENKENEEREKDEDEDVDEDAEESVKSSSKKSYSCPFSVPRSGVQTLCKWPAHIDKRSVRLHWRAFANCFVVRTSPSRYSFDRSH